MKGCISYAISEDRRFPGLDLTGMTKVQLTKLKSLHERDPKAARRQAEEFAARRKKP